jgi:RimJ/RimL family protein N-acetyltransferase
MDQSIKIEKATGTMYQRALDLLEISPEFDSVARHTDHSPAIFVARSNSRIQVAIQVETRSRLQANCTAPHVVTAVSDATLTELVRVACAHIDAEAPPPALTTVLSGTISEQTDRALRENGFRHAGTVAFYLCHAHRFPKRDVCPVDLVPAGGSQVALADVMRRTCENTLDLPEMLTAWSPRQMLAHLSDLPGNRPDLWYIAKYRGNEVGVLLLEVESPECRLVYVGIVPEYRGRGWGHALVHEAMRRAGEERVERIVLSVDTKNAPAVRVYESAGFLSYLTQQLYFRPRA